MNEKHKLQCQIAAYEATLIKKRERLAEIMADNDFPIAAHRYWYLINYGDKWEVRCGMFGPGSKLDQRRKAAGNCYRTEDEAKEVCDTRNTLTEKMEGWL